MARQPVSVKASPFGITIDKFATPKMPDGYTHIYRSYPFMGIWYPSFVLKSGATHQWVNFTQLMDTRYPFMGKNMGKIYSFFQSKFSGKKIIFFNFFQNFNFFSQSWFFSRFFIFFIFSLLFHSILSLFTGIVFFFLKFVL
jgi:hypothetical protein